MRHIFYIDDLEKLNLKKDTTLFFALTLQNQGVECFVLFEKNLGWGNQTCTLSVQKFEGFLDGFYISEFKLGTTELIAPRKGDTIHMRLDPPFDSRYLRYLWILDQWERRGVRVINRPRGIMQFNEKLLAYEQTGSVPSWVGQDLAGFREFHQFLKTQKVKDIILKPLDLYSGIGVEKWSVDDNKLEERFMQKAADLAGPIVAQSFMPEVYKGEIRAIYYGGEHIGSILKKPKAGEFLSNIAQGAAFEAIELSQDLDAKCKRICAELSIEGVDWVAFDILGSSPTEVNVTCPGLLVEVSHAHQKNLALEIIKRF